MLKNKLSIFGFYVQNDDPNLVVMIVRAYFTSQRTRNNPGMTDEMRGCTVLLLSSLL